MVEINLLPWRKIISQKNQENIRKSIFYLSSFLLGFFLLWRLFFVFSIASSERHIGDLDNQLSKLKDQLQQRKQNEKSQASLKAVNLLQQKIQHSFIETIQKMPDHFWVKEIIREKNNIHLIGEAKSMREIAEFHRLFPHLEYIELKQIEDTHRVNFNVRIYDSE